MNGFTILQACLGCMYQGELIVNHLRTGRNLAYLMTKVDASRKTSFRKMVDGVSPKIQHGIQDSHIQVQRSSCKLSKTQFKKGGSMFTLGSLHIYVPFMARKSYGFWGCRDTVLKVLPVHRRPWHPQELARNGKRIPNWRFTKSSNSSLYHQ
jgi:hypothetical protein